MGIKVQYLLLSVLCQTHIFCCKGLQKYHIPWNNSRMLLLISWRCLYCTQVWLQRSAGAEMPTSQLSSAAAPLSWASIREVRVSDSHNVWKVQSISGRSRVILTDWQMQTHSSHRGLRVCFQDNSEVLVLCLISSFHFNLYSLLNVNSQTRNI